MLREALGIKKVVLITGRTDMRKGIDGLVQLLLLKYKMNPAEEGTLYLFCGRRRDLIKALCFDYDGYVLLQKRLLNGAYQWPRNSNEAMSLTREQYRQLMDGFTVVSTIKAPAA